MSEEVIDRFARQSELVPQARLKQLLVTVIGVGAVGRQVALQLAAMGVPKLQLIDFDTVEPTNITTQGYRERDLGMHKVDATGEAVLELDPTIELTCDEDRYRPKMQVGEVIFCCVDSIAVRGTIWKSLGQVAEFWSDARMLGETIRVLSVEDDKSREYYPTTLFEASEAEPGRCTARSTIYTASIAAGLMVHQFARFLRGQALDKDISLSLLASELVVTEG